MLYFTIFIGGLICGFIFHRVLIKRKCMGVLRIDCYDGLNLFLELSKEISTFRDNKYVVLKIKDENYISQK